ncbi:hypothetical protein BDZ88DRAFT_435501 [Geranomyces variabilis]|nr:hypothetical protein BDZ88DRAFT_435501 [Geranomyces variabilis]
MFGQIVVGPPGSGKTTYCNGMGQFYTATNRQESGTGMNVRQQPINKANPAESLFARPFAIINLDPANDGMPKRLFRYTPDIDISELITLQDTMEEFSLGPNGGLIYCMEYLEKNLDWLQKKLEGIKDKYLIFDCPGQVELFTHHNSLKNIIDSLRKTLDIRLCCVHLVDSHYCVDPSKYVALLLLSLKTMIQLELPHVNVLSKLDLLEAYGKTAFNLEFYTEVQDLDYLLERLNDGAFGKKYEKLNRALCDLVNDYSLVGFHTLAIEDKQSVIKLAESIDKANGYIHASMNVNSGF